MYQVTDHDCQNITYTHHSLVKILKEAIYKASEEGKDGLTKQGIEVLREPE